MIWLITWEIILIDILTLNLKGSQEHMKWLIETFEQYVTVEGVAENIENIFMIIRNRIL